MIIVDLVRRPFERLATYLWTRWGIAPVQVARHLFVASAVSGGAAMLALLLGDAPLRLFSLPWRDWQSGVLLAGVLAFLAILADATSLALRGREILSRRLVMSMAPLVLLSLVALCADFVSVLVARASSYGNPVGGAMLLVSIAIDLFYAATLKERRPSSGGAVARRTDYGGLAVVVLGLPMLAATLAWAIASPSIASLFLLALAAGEFLSGIFMDIERPPGAPRRRRTEVWTGSHIPQRA